MSNTISSLSYFARTVSWLTKQTSETKASDENTSTPIKWLARRSRATNISIFSGILFLGSFISGHFLKDTSNRFLYYLNQGIRWFFALVSITIPFTNIKEQDKDLSSIFNKKSYLNLEDPDLKQNLVKAIVNDINIPISSGGINLPDIIPRRHTEKNKPDREKIYEVLKDLAQDENDLLFLNTDIEQIPENLRERIIELKKVLIEQYISEFPENYASDAKDICSQKAKNLLEDILMYSKGIDFSEIVKLIMDEQREISTENIFNGQDNKPIWESENIKYKEVKYKALENLFQDEKYSKNNTNERVIELHRGIFTAYKKEKQLIETNSPTTSIDALKSLESALLKSTVIDQSLWNEEYNFKQFENWAKSITQDKVDLKKVFGLLSVELKKTLPTTEDLLQTNTGISELLNMIKTDLRFSIDNTPVESQVEILHFFTLYLGKILERIADEDNEEKIFRILSNIVHNKDTFPHVKRNLDFFNNPSSNTVPGLALKVIHENRLCFNDDYDFKYIDPYDLRNLILPQAVEMISSDRTKCKTNGFVLSGFPGTGKSLLATAIANQLAIPLYPLESSFEEKMTGLQEAIDNAPCVLLLDEMGNSLPSNTSLRTLKSKLNEAHKKGVIVIGTTNSPLINDSIKLSNIDDKGSSRQLEEELSKVIDSEAINTYQKIFIFHKPFTQKQGEQLAREFLKPYIKSGKIKAALNYARIGKVLKYSTPASISSTLTKLVRTAKEPISEKELITEFEKNAVYKYTNKEFQATRT